MKNIHGNFKKDGFEGQMAIVLPKSIINQFCIKNKIIDKAFITDIGYYPKAKFHYRKRAGVEQNILIYCVEGKGQVTLDKNKYTINPGDFFVIPFGKPHAYQTDIENPWTIYWCHFKGEQTDEIIKQIYNKFGSFKASVPFTDSRIELFNKLYQNLEKGYSFENISYVNLLFPQFLGSFLFNQKFTPNLALDTPDIIDLSIQLMQENIFKSLSLKELAEHVNSSPSNYSAVFRKKTGFPPVAYFNHLKIQKACQFLQFTDLRIKEIALRLGIEDQYYFSRLFTKIMSCSPSTYREQKTAVR
ncbi:helix-turn-helix domain-containing protein [Pedobacter petrophilus]|uniref:Helix-turn-helix domain-containing protein n=2 Tax=Pedobacter TaxID=84567 RepID=A0A7K0FZI4_9SPHI|nr:AraC family transcriptional regulator [Pedobacter petrophilus]MRX76988.1 helix-turn-helix domain-containing protein [Pedobacter petrophilus]